jgi:hypothetical protein
MPSVNTIEKFVKLVTAGHFIEAMQPGRMKFSTRPGKPRRQQPK